MKSRPEKLAVLRTLPRRAHDLSRKTVRDSQRWRILEAITDVVAMKGYADATVADVIAGAGVSRKTFYEYFDDKESCFLKAYDIASQRFVLALATVGSTIVDHRERVTAQLRAYLECLSRSPHQARVFLVDVLVAGPRGIARREHVNGRFADLLLGTEGRGEVVRKAIIGGVNDVVAGAIIASRGDRLMDLLGPLTDFVHSALRLTRGAARLSSVRERPKR